MERLLILAFGALAVTAEAAEPPQLSASFSFAHVAQADDKSFLDGGFGKTPFGSGDEGAVLGGGFIEWRQSLGASWESNLTLTNTPDLDHTIGVSEASLTYRPLPISGRRVRVKIGAFRPPISFEHDGVGWTTHYTTLASAVNSWIGEEVGGLGAEIRIARDRAQVSSPWAWDVFAAGFFGNDPAGTLLAWNGWNFWQGQTRWGDKIPLPDLPIFGVARHQSQVAQPYLETDHRPGYYVGATLERSASVRMRVVYWDNRADPNSRNDGQWGWHTRFGSVALQATLPWNVGLLAQWLGGQSRTWDVPGIGAVVDMDFDARYVALTRAFARQWLTLRYDHYAVDDHDINPLDDNNERGHAWTASWGWNISRQWTVAFECLWIRGYREAREQLALEDYADETLTLATLRWQL